MPPPGYYGRPYPPPRSGGGAVGAVLAVLFVFVVVGGLVAFATMGGRDNSSASYSTSTPSFTYTPPTWATSTSETATTARSTTTPYPSTTKPYYRTTTVVPTTKPAGPQPVAATAANPIFDDHNSGLINISCGYPRWGSDVASATAFFQAAKSCLDRMWQPVLVAQNLPFSSPTVSVPASGANAASPCGSSGSYAAFYCSANNTIYMPLDHIQTEVYGDRWYVYLGVFAHEYGHHVQAISGIMSKMSRDRYNAGTNSAAGLELSRRLELEAQCFGGMFISSSEVAGTVSNDQAYYVKQDNYQRGDDHSDVRDHGANQHYGAWYAQGEDNNRTWMCNTWNSPSDSVS
ncbi:neutral zinc metallopeptidase [Nocardia sp. BSTN01]|uniref:neutral zinc metallopeptidase n=1 Tax=Nocardia sp. BSTN01 TaxID=2783665 RepID=UPI001E4D9C9D|nr:neutral zinc metallopeptidase [Nocardia sp. BSTN01]